VFRCDHKKRELNIHHGFSKNGINLEIDNDPTPWEYADPELARFEVDYDPIVIWLEDRY